LLPALVDENSAPVHIDIGDLNSYQLAHPDGRIEEQFQHDFMLDVAAVLNNPEEPLEVALAQQLRQPVFFPGLAQAKFAACLLADVEEAGVIEVLLPSDPDEAGHHG
jgi:hypothetical protein